MIGNRSLAGWGAAVGLAVLAGWSYQVLASRRDVADVSRTNYRASRELSGKILQLRQQPSRAGLSARSSGELLRRIEQAAQSARIPQQSLSRIDPERARRVAETTYKQQSTQLELQGVSLEQLTTLLHALSSGEDAMQVSRLRFGAPRRASSGATAESWDAEVTLTYLIYSPTTPGTSIQSN